MQDERPAPPVTITDPEHPGRYGDVLTSGEEREPWRPGRRTRRAVGSLLVLALVVGGPALWLDHRRDARAAELAADRSALDELWVDLVADASGDGSAVLLLNNGPHAITVLGLGVEDGPLSDVSLVVDSLERTPVSVPPKGCAERSLDAGLIVRVRTFRGDERRLHFDLAGDDADVAVALSTAFDHACGVYGPEEALRVGDVLVERLPGYVDVSTTVFNLSVEPVVITDIRSPTPVAVTAEQRLPLTVPAAQPGLTGDAVELDLRIRVSSCDELGYTDAPPGEVWAELDTGPAEGGDASGTPLPLGATYAEAVQELVELTC